MKGHLLLATGVLLVASCSVKSPEEKKFREAVSDLYIEASKPFYHGVASGDPLSDRVILWTRVTPDDSTATLDVIWEISADESFASILQRGSTSTTAAHDFTVKIDVDKLEPDSHYYYRFHALDHTSPIGRTKTAPVNVKDSLRIAVVSCSNWEFGYFNAYALIAQKEVDAVVHLGDYIYEYGVGVYGDTTIGRTHLPTHECISLSDYRTRYSQYHLDEGLQKVEQRHPFITIWDDHEVANNVFTEGAQNHQPSEGDFFKRKEAARQAYYEWLPIREGNKLYRSFSFGPLADLLMMDERLEGRTAPVDSATAPDFNKEDRTMLGPEQLAWFEDHLKNSKAVWKIIGNQVLFSNLNIDGLYRAGMPKNLDAWDGYPAEQKRIEKFLLDHKSIDNVVFVSGDTHAAWAIEVPNATGYNSKQKSLAIELGTTSVSSGNGNEGNPDSLVLAKEKTLLKMNAHVKYLNNRNHGYLLLTLHPKMAKAEWFAVKTLRKPDLTETLDQRYIIRNSSTKLE